MGLALELCRVGARSPRQAKLLDILLDRSDWEDSDSDAVMAALDDPKARETEAELAREHPAWELPVLSELSLASKRSFGSLAPGTPTRSP